MESDSSSWRAQSMRSSSVMSTVSVSAMGVVLDLDEPAADLVLLCDALLRSNVTFLGDLSSIGVGE